jgi:hypothetical protein
VLGKSAPGSAPSSSDAVPTSKALQEELVQKLVETLPGGWIQYLVHYENCSINGQSFEKYTAQVVVPHGEEPGSLSLEQLDALIHLQTAMASSGREQWSHIDIALQSSGAYKLGFGYGIPPLVAKTLRIAGQ